MARFEMSMAGGEKIIVDHPSDDMPELLANLLGKDFLLLSEIRSSSSGGTQEVIVASRQVTLVRKIDGESRQSTTFRPKR